MNLSVAEVRSVIWRRRYWVLVPALVGLLAGVGMIFIVPPVYRASTLVLVEAQKVPEDYVKATVTTSLQERLKTIQQQVGNRDNLERVIRELGLYPQLMAAGRVDDAVDALRDALTLEVQGTRVFRVFFKGSDPRQVAATANRITRLFIDQNLRQRMSQAAGTASFLSSQLALLKSRLEQQEARIASYKQEHLEELPEQRETNLRAIEQLQSKLQINLQADDQAQARQISLQREAAPERPSGPTALEQARAKLASLLTRYTEAYPEVIRARAEVEQLEREEQQRPPPAPAQVTNPALERELGEVRHEIGSLAAERDRIKESIATYQARLENTPRIELQLTDLSRDHDNLRHSYDELLDKKVEADLAQDLEARQQGEHFTVLESAMPPEEPYAPNRRLLLAVGLGLGILVGCGLALLRHETDSSYLDAAALRRAFPGVRVLAEIPSLTSDAMRPRRGKRPSAEIA